MTSRTFFKSIMGAVAAVALCFGCHKGEEKGAWTIVKQKGHENYGFVTELGTGFVIAGFTNKALAIAGMETHREWVRRPRPKTIERDESMWEVVP